MFHNLLERLGILNLSQRLRIPRRSIRGRTVWKGKKNMNKEEFKDDDGNDWWGEWSSYD